ncbi:histone-like nucleoid-structuring protein Lsr2 [Nocardia brasiliensis]|uniref:LSR2 protein n=1 Tax=Nocardia brasiliensis (strain ATCC 700358 / HUJEG-1) TaxID=1133849 RepID=K0F0K6_NOCB7|nr:Lsr2 family protein [Nocardia brasiliensis]AFU02929.1 LSR2 protein [Nocardia brasiliensis ATCC 700358]OCF86003.1 nucleoid-associated protein Lsr2 [Nocardia brasiliensis]
MVRRVIVEWIDDHDGRSAADERVEFGLDGVGYELDLTACNSARLRGVFEQWIPHAREIGLASQINPAKRTTHHGYDHTAAIRRWARANSIEVSDRGRFSNDVLERYYQANG